ncbi:hypothetical protein ACH5RR_032557 [Cinchona calisaya]|uniref:Protein kinase domain-containing protein n=1 Tax=Cinchona calisaya TaxID=153742 RepID=A0ABD2YMM7_9GENT
MGRWGRRVGRGFDGRRKGSGLGLGWRKEIVNFIKCNPRDGRVSEVSLDGLGLSGKIGRGLEKLQDLKVLSLSKNNLTGNISPELALINGLEKLKLSQNNLIENIPSTLSNMSSIQFLDLSENSLSGPISVDLFENCKSLQFISLAGNLLEGAFPTTLSRCTNLNHQNFSNNHFSGDPNFKENFQSLTSLRMLDLSNNELSGQLPSKSLQKLNALSFLSLSNNLLDGDFPQWINKMSSLEYLDFSGNSLQGSLPMSIGEMNALKFLGLSNNRVTGNIPSSMAWCTSLSVIQLRGNAFNGIITAGLSEMRLDELDLSRNELTRFHPNLSVLDIPNSALTGSIPGDICDSGSLRILQLDENSLTKPIPDEIGNCSSLINSQCFSHCCNFSSCGGDSSWSDDYNTNQASARRRLAFVENALESMCSSSTRSSSVAAGKLILFDSKTSPDCISSNLDSVLSKATEIGGGIFGTVYNASLGREGRIVAIRKPVTSNIVEYPEDFDREVRILGKARHQNLIPLRGYYWTPQLPLLVSDYAPEGSLQAKLHDHPPSAAPLSWPTRFKVVLGTAKGLAHLLHSSRPPIIHYNVKPAWGTEEEVLPVLKLALVCTSQIPSSRPSMEEVVQILEVIMTPVPQRMEAF